MNGFASAVNHTAVDDEELSEWRDALASLVANAGPARARQILDLLAREGRAPHIDWKPRHGTPYVNSISVDQQPAFPGDLATEERLASLVRWNALAMVVRANQAYGELGGHIASYASAADLFEVGFNHFFRARNDGFGGDLVFYQPHSAPGIYARAFLEGRLSEQDLAHYRQEIGGAKAGARGLSSYPHPWLMPDFWQFPTGSMGIGPISSIFQARFMRYLQHRGLQDTTDRHVWGVFGDGEMDEPESMSALTLAAREGLDNLTWVVNCNLQRLDGPVRGNGRIIDELEALFGGAGWNVIKLVWGSDWDALLANDADGALVDTLSHTVDGQFQTFAAKDGAYNREHFFGQSPSLAALVEGMSDEQIDRLKRGGHDMVKIHAAYHAARRVKGKPTVILAQTKKGFGMGEAGQGKMTTHQQKKLDREALIAFRNRFQLPLSDAQAESLSFFKPADDSLELRYLHQRRQALGGYVPSRSQLAAPVTVPPVTGYAVFATAAEGKEMSTTMAFVRMLTNLLKDKALGPRIVPIVADEARTFGMANLFKQIGIYSSVGQRYEPEDIGSILSYREATDGQILEEGISEASAISSWVAAATSYSVHGLRMLPFYIYYSMFGFQRVGDLIWAAADQRARGFLLGATAGRTTLGGEGLQHQDGSSHLTAATVPNCRAYDPAFAGEFAVILDHGMRQMLEHDVDEFYYVTLMNENYPQPTLPQGVEGAIIKGLYRLEGASAAQVRLLGSGTLLREAQAAAQLLADDWQVASEVFSVTSFSELAREAREVERWNRLHPLQVARTSHLAGCLPTGAPVVAVSDYVRAVPQMIGSYLDSSYTVLGTDGFGRSDTRAALRDFFEVDRHHIVLAALTALVEQGRLEPRVCQRAIEQYGLLPERVASWAS
ncbi:MULTISPECIES: alpha-ketoglutarate dehydrogenase [unclassified Pseudomonas]|uniref:alpha-ketoglutarate dehydrogenase n=1 Tax=unclassified Pseudomonas TaxID=196821 RepID=UPI000C88E0D5|nr:MULTISPECIES: alpha-ketoglutarate dehydrogenase [unclassified Pseudomonas]PMX13944.1 pyruvate dehydrogenase (acetyl-transferring), homodimeric type [Pseudomonas sp. GW460-12]PMX29030.1 pyruvate dehydrogenase (acetyl-transferring), homodimeric type [Pseudomonas sp. MPR-R2A4]PMX41811.1 pyruvate dehydrogenase (acetyl-transferring), homodimeric type [Pseudomonas sp. MPR-R2A7]PMX46684.1 pyruvate dehydrogenase (acetyl-transferring), homodimeric type [Pseudomonas sp. MPR-R2A6]PMX81590.1 pyruvate d